MCKWTHTDTDTPTHHTHPPTTYRAETLNSVENRYKSWRFESHNCLWDMALGKQYIWLIKSKRCVLQRIPNRKWTQLCVPVWIWGLVPNLTMFRDELWGSGWAMKLYPAKRARPQQWANSLMGSLIGERLQEVGSTWRTWVTGACPEIFPAFCHHQRNLSHATSATMLLYSPTVMQPTDHGMKGWAS